MQLVQGVDWLQILKMSPVIPICSQSENHCYIEAEHHPCPLLAASMGHWSESPLGGTSLGLAIWRAVLPAISAMAPLDNCRQPRAANLDWWQEAISGVDHGLAALLSLPRGLDRGHWSVARPKKLLKELDDGKAGAGQGLPGWQPQCPHL